MVEQNQSEGKQESTRVPPPAASLAVDSSVSDDKRFDPSRLRLSQDFESQSGVKKLLLTVPVKKPNKQEFIRVQQDEAYRLQTFVLELKEERETYLVERSLWDELASELVPKVLMTAVTRQGVVFLWPIRLPTEDGRHDPWSRSAMDAADRAQVAWVRIAANISLGAYDVFEANGELPPPEWPELSFERLLEIAFHDRFIDQIDHPIVRRLRGEL